MPLKILIALAMVNKSPVTTCRGSLSSMHQQPVALLGHVRTIDPVCIGRKVRFTDFNLSLTNCRSHGVY